MDIAAYMADVGQQAREAATAIARASTATRNQALLATADALDAARDNLSRANRKDLDNGRASGLDPAMLE